MLSEVISIIVPVYNVAKYLDDCLTSVCEQTYTNLEIIVVDDGSTDNSLEICKKYAEADNRIKVYTKPNGGLSDARNYGIDRANGDYFIFVDSDDYIGNNHVMQLYSSLCSQDADMVQAESVRVNDDSSYNILEKQNVKIRKSGGFTEVYSQLINSAWNKIYKRELFETIRFPKGLLYEDLPTTFKVAMNSKKIVLLDNAEYFYRSNPNSIMSQPITEKNLDMIKVVDNLREYTWKHKPEYKRLIDNILINRLYYWFIVKIPYTHPYSKTFWKEIKKVRNSAIKLRPIKQVYKKVFISFFGRKISYILIKKQRETSGSK